jgi:uncharacterized membrane protein YeaQ/YmgE (transglycosylase-associated protein family)
MKESGPRPETVDVRWRSLYRVAAASALITAVLTPITVAVFVIWPPPYEGAVNEWFRLFQDNWLLGLLSLDLLFIVVILLLVPIFLALFVALRQYSESWMALGTVLGLVAVVAYLSSNTAFEMLDLSNQYADADTDTERAELLAAGRAMLVTYGGTAFHAYYIIGSLAGIIVSAVMRRSRAFGKAPAYMGILGNVIGLGLYLPVVASWSRSLLASFFGSGTSCWRTGSSVSAGLLSDA